VDPLVSQETGGQPPLGPATHRTNACAVVTLPAGPLNARKVAERLNDFCGIDDITADDVRQASHVVLQRDGEFVWFRIDTNDVNLQGIEFGGPDWMPIVAIVLHPLFAGWDKPEVLDALDRAYAGIGGSVDRTEFA
jgi:hypothetical protein